MPPSRTTKRSTTTGRGTKQASASPRAPLTLAEVMHELERSGSEQTRKTYRRHGAAEPMFGVSFATLKTLAKRIGVDHGLALELWRTGNFDARNLAVKIVDPVRMTATELDRWARDTAYVRMCSSYIGSVAAEGPHAAAKLARWATSQHEGERCAHWALLQQLAMRDPAMPDTVFLERLAHIERSIHAAPNSERSGMNLAVIAIGTRNGPLRNAALAASKRIGRVDVDHGNTACKTPDAAGSIEKAWAHSTAKGFASPAEHERSRESPRTRC